MDDPPRIPDPFSSRHRFRPRKDPRDEQIGIGTRHPLLAWIGVWALGIGAIAGLALLLPERTAGIAAIVILVGLLTTVRL